MKSFEDLLQYANDTKWCGEVDISEYFHLLGYSSKYTCLRNLKRRKDCNIIYRQEVVSFRKGKSAYLPIYTFINILSDIPEMDTRWKDIYIYYWRGVYRNSIFRFCTTERKERRYRLKGYIEFKGTLYDYSLNTLNFSEEMKMCPYDCYRIANESFNFTWRNMEIDLDTNKPVAAFDSLEPANRRCFLKFIDIVIDKLKPDQKTELKIRAYRIVIEELLDYQDELDAEVLSKFRKKSSKYDIKALYREASKLYHPDVNNTPEAEGIMKQVNKFYEENNYHALNLILKKAKKSV